MPIGIIALLLFLGLFIWALLTPSSMDKAIQQAKEKGNINTPLDLAMENQVDRFNLAIDVIDRVPRLAVSAAHVKDELKNLIIKHQRYADENGIDPPTIRNWSWPLS